MTPFSDRPGNTSGGQAEARVASPGFRVSPGARSRQRRSRNRGADLALTAVFAALIAALSVLPGIPVGALGVPISLQTLGVLLAGLILGPARAAAAVGLYLLVGLAGLPVFSGFRGGLGVLALPSAGFLLGFLPGAAAAGALSRLAWRQGAGQPPARRAGLRTVLLMAAAAVASFLVIHPLGIAGMMINGRLSLEAALLADLLFVPGDIIKCVVAGLLAAAVFRAFPRMGTGAE